MILQWCTLWMARITPCLIHPRPRERRVDCSPASGVCSAAGDADAGPALERLEAALLAGAHIGSTEAARDFQDFVARSRIAGGQAAGQVGSRRWGGSARRWPGAVTVTPASCALCAVRCAAALGRRGAAGGAALPGLRRLPGAAGAPVLSRPQRVRGLLRAPARRLPRLQRALLAGRQPLRRRRPPRRAPALPVQAGWLPPRPGRRAAPPPPAHLPLQVAQRISSSAATEHGVSSTRRLRREYKFPRDFSISCNNLLQRSATRTTELVVINL